MNLCSLILVNRAHYRILIPIQVRIILLASIFSLQLMGATDTLVVKNFIIKSQIILLNRKPPPAEIFAAIKEYDIIKTPANKIKYIEWLFADSLFAQSIYDIYVNEYLQGVDDDLVTLAIFDDKKLLSKKSEFVFYDVFNGELKKILRFKSAPEQLGRNEITISQLQQMCIDNKFYDDKNMGPDNFVNSTFMYLFSRNPTRYELEEGKKMFDHQAGVLFHENGFSKEDYLNILFGSAEYKEGQVRYWYQRILNRNPKQAELIDEVYTNNFDLRKTISGLLLRKEFAGF
jgi:hypothetical protein